MPSSALLRTKVIHEGWSTMRLATVRLDDGTEVEREVEDHGRAVTVLPYDPERRTALLVRQLRLGPLVFGEADPHLVEAPAGIVEDEEPAAAARREALEEAGVRLVELEAFGAPYATGGVSTERIDLFLARYSTADQVEAGGGAKGEHENITVLELPLRDLLAQALAGEIRDLKTLALILLLHARRPELFA